MSSKTRIALSALVAGAALAALTAFATTAPAPAVAAKPNAAGATAPATAAAAGYKKESTSTADHSKFKELQKEFKSGPEVTKACLTCHTEAAKQIQKTQH